MFCHNKPSQSLNNHNVEDTEIIYLVFTYWTGQRVYLTSSLSIFGKHDDANKMYFYGLFI